MSELRILHLEDNPHDSELVRYTLEAEGVAFALDHVATRAAFERALQSTLYSIILSDFSLPSFNGLAALEMARSLAPDTPFLFLSGTIGEDRAVESLKSGAADYILKDRLQRLAPAILRAHNDGLQRKQQRADAEQIRRQAELLNQAKDAIFVRNLDQEITFWNGSAERIYGWTAAEIVGRRASDLLYKAGSTSREEIWKTVLEKGAWTGEIAQVTKSGKEIIVSSHRTLLRDSAGVPNAVLNINTDITEKKELEGQLLRTQRMDTIGALAGGIAHDLNNMLAPIIMATEILQDEIVDAQQRRMLETARQSAHRGAEMVKQILHFARGGEKNARVVDLKAVIDDVYKFIAKTFPPAIEIQQEVGWDLLPVSGDSTQLHQVLLNLCINARDAMVEAGVLHIEAANQNLSDYKAPDAAHVSGPFVEIMVSDTGGGIPPEILGRIFDPFFTTKAPGKGTGLGLATVATIIRNHKGFLEVHNTPGKGATFRIFLPGIEAQRETGSEARGAEPPLGRGEWILLVDDELALLEMTKQLLEASGYQVLAAANGAEALIAFETHREKIAVVVTDMVMPELGGAELIARIRTRFPDIPTVCLTGSTEETSVLQKRASSATAFLRKPCSSRDLLRILGQLLREKQCP